MRKLLFGLLFLTVSAFAVVPPYNGGTGISNGPTHTITVGGAFSSDGAITFTGAYGLTFSLTGTTVLALPQGPTTLAAYDGSNAIGTWGISISGNSATVTNGIYSTDTGTVTNTMLAGAIADSKLSTISTGGKVSNSATTAASANTASAIVARNSSGNFSAGTISADGLAVSNSTASSLITVSSTNHTAAQQDSFAAINFVDPNSFTQTKWGYAFQALNSASAVVQFAAILADVTNPTASEESSTMNFILKNGGTTFTVLTLNGTNQTSVFAFPIVTFGLSSSDHISISAAGKTLKIKQGTNACAGTGAVMVAGVVTVNTTCAATGDIVLTSRTAAGGTLGLGTPTVTISNGVSFTLTSSSVLDTSTYSWIIIKAA